MFKDSFLKSNDIFTKLRGNDLLDLIVDMENYFLEYRDYLNLDKDLTIGIEVEYESVPKKTTDLFVKKNIPSWHSRSDGSLSSGGEVVSPILTDCNKTWDELKKLCKYLRLMNADTMHSASAHMHFGVLYFEDLYHLWVILLKLYMVYEPVLFRFLYGDMVNAREGIYRYAGPFAPILYNNRKKIESLEGSDDITRLFRSFDRYYALNLSHVNLTNPSSVEKNTFEVRAGNGSTNHIVLQNNINAISKMLMAIKHGLIDVEYLDYYIENEFIDYDDCNLLYNAVNLKDALRFVDSVFTTNLDKVYFLRQYIKDFEDNFGLIAPKKAKQFTR